MANRMIIGDCTFKNKQIMIQRDNHGKYYIFVDGVETQKRLTAVEFVRWAMNAMNDGCNNG